MKARKIKAQERHDVTGYDEMVHEELHDDWLYQALDMIDIGRMGRTRCLRI